MSAATNEMNLLALTYAVQTIGLMTGLTWRTLEECNDRAYFRHAFNCGLVLVMCAHPNEAQMLAIEYTTRLALLAYVGLFFVAFPQLDDATMLRVQTTLSFVQGIVWVTVVVAFYKLCAPTKEIV